MKQGILAWNQWREANRDITPDLFGANLRRANFHGAKLGAANLGGANLYEADLFQADHHGADLENARLVQTTLEGANLTGRQIYGISVWIIYLAGARQADMVITPFGEIDTIISKAVLILGRFTPERKAVLDAIRDELRRRNYLPILFDFEKPASRDLTETISTLAHMARFIIADRTEPSSLPKELEAIVPTLAVPVPPVMEGMARPYAMFPDYWKYSWVLKVYRDESLEGLIAALGDKVIAPAEVKVQELEATRKAIAEELLKQRTV